MIHLPIRKPALTTILHMDRLADEMANGCPSIAQAGRRLNFAPAHTDYLWRRIRAGLGAQAR